MTEEGMKERILKKVLEMEYQVEFKRDMLSNKALEIEDCIPSKDIFSRDKKIIESVIEETMKEIKTDLEKFKKTKCMDCGQWNCDNMNHTQQYVIAISVRNFETFWRERGVK